MKISFLKFLLLIISAFFFNIGPVLSDYSNQSLNDVENNEKYLVEALRKQQIDDKPSLKELLNAARASSLDNDPDIAAILWGRALVRSPKNPEILNNYAASILTLLKNNFQGYNNYYYKVQAQKAAYNAYKLTSDKKEKAEALWYLGGLFATDDNWEEAIKCYRESLGLNAVKGRQAQYSAALEKYGFKVAGYSVDNNYEDGKTRVCFSFNGGQPSSDKAVEWQHYVRIAEKADFTVGTDYDKLCISGLSSGSAYSITLKQGLPSRSGDKLAEDSSYNIKISDGDPSIRFTGNNYVLPRTGQVGIPVVTQNVTSLRINILRFGERNLVSLLKDNEGDFLSIINAYTFNEYKAKKTVPVWSGTLSVDNKPNTDVVTAFPVAEAVGGFEPGVYLMVARHAASNETVSDEFDYDEYDYEDVATQWFVVSDVGITAFSGESGVHVAVNSLQTAKPMPQARVSLIAVNNEILETRIADENGFVSFSPDNGSTKGMQPAMVVVSADKDHAFLDLGRSAFDLTDRGVRGASPLGRQNVFLYSERGVYRPGETVFATALLRDHNGAAIEKTPLIIKVFRPDGVEYETILTEDEAIGGRSVSVSLLSDVPMGTWRVSAYTDPKMPALGSMTFAVEDYVPERMKVELSSAMAYGGQGQSVPVNIQADYLYGAPGGNLSVKGQISMVAADGYPNFEGYSFGQHNEVLSGETEELDETERTDENGKLTVQVPIPGISTTKPLKAVIRFDVNEDGGRSVFKTLTLPVLPDSSVIGIKPLFAELTGNDIPEFEIVVLDEHLKPLTSSEVKWELSIIRNRYQWYRKDGQWGYEATRELESVRKGKLAFAEKPEKLSLPVESGYRYQLQVEKKTEGEQAVTSTVEFSKGWFGSAKLDTPDKLDIALNKESFSSGDIMQIRLLPQEASEVFLAIVSDKVYPLKTVSVPKEGSLVDIEVSSEWGSGGYLIALSHQPLDEKARHQPARSLGVAWFSIGKAERVLDIDIAKQPILKPSGTVSLPVQVRGLQPQEQAHITLALVDNGILSLTDFKTPDPVDYFFGQRTMSMAIRDLYGYLIDGMQGNKGAIRFGGDEGASKRPQPGLAQAPLVRFSGIIKADENGKADIEFNLPEFNGSGRVMVIGWTKDRIGSAEDDITIRDEVILAGTLPRFMRIGDETSFTTVLHNVDGPEGEYTLDLKMIGPLQAEAGMASRKFAMKKGEKSVFRTVLQAQGIGEAWIDAVLNGPEGYNVKQTFRLAVLPGSPVRLAAHEISLKSGETYEFKQKLFEGIIPGTGSADITLAPVGGFDVPSLLSRLDRYPYGCSEQITSRVLPLLYANELSLAASLGRDDALDGRIDQTILRVLGRQASSGSFGRWRIDSDHDIWLNAYISDFLTRASELKFAVSRPHLDKALGYLQNDVANSARIEDEAGIAYAAYVLARNGRPVISDLRYLADNKLKNFKNPLARAHIAAGLALLGDDERASRSFLSAMDQLKKETYNIARSPMIYSPNYGSRLRDIAAMLTLAHENPSLRNFAGDLVHELQAERKDRAERQQYYTSTQENAWLIMAAQAVQETAKTMTSRMGSVDKKGIVYHSVQDEDLSDQALSITNTSDTDLVLSVTVSGNPVNPPPSVADKGISIEREYFSIDGELLDGDTISQNDRIVAVLTIHVDAKDADRFVLSDYLPAGLELENPNLGDQNGSVIGWLDNLSSASHTEYQDERFMVAFERGQGEADTATKTETFRYAYSVRAVSPGHYIVPAAESEVMYEPYIYGRSEFGELVVSESGNTEKTP